MFGLFRNSSVDPSPYVRRIIDRTSPNLPREDDQRSNIRYNRSIPAVIVPWNGKRVDLSQAVVAVTRDLSDHGMGLICNKRIDVERVLVALCEVTDAADEPPCFRGVVHSKRHIARSFWELGIRLDDYANEEMGSKLDLLFDLVRELSLEDESV